jgi:hypothetical protein
MSFRSRVGRDEDTRVGGIHKPSFDILYIDYRNLLDVFQAKPFLLEKTILKIVQVLWVYNSSIIHNLTEGGGGGLNQNKLEQ